MSYINKSFSAAIITCTYLVMTIKIGKANIDRIEDRIDSSTIIVGHFPILLPIMLRFHIQWNIFQSQKGREF